MQAHLARPAQSIKLTGRVLGRDVILEVPVTISPTLPATGKTINDLHLPVHTLATRSLIQQLEGSPSSPERDADIVRLALQFPLARSQTSFVAIAEAHDDEGETLLTGHEPPPLVNTGGGSGRGAGQHKGGAFRHRIVLEYDGPRDEDEGGREETEEEEERENEAESRVPILIPLAVESLA